MPASTTPDVLAAEVNLPDFPGQYPDCAHACVAALDYGVCNATDIKCLCTSWGVNDMITCFSKLCDEQDYDQSESSALSACDGVGIFLDPVISIFPHNPSSSATTTIHVSSSSTTTVSLASTTSHAVSSTTRRIANPTSSHSSGINTPTSNPDNAGSSGRLKASPCLSVWALSQRRLPSRSGVSGGAERDARSRPDLCPSGMTVEDPRTRGLATSLARRNREGPAAFPSLRHLMQSVLPRSRRRSSLHTRHHTRRHRTRLRKTRARALNMGVRP
ncbi:hypothetical protein BV20DRAFT_789277 [Pilatotrama ljubarskyi]|nr:hypothetical protein BV20DRAFT_789277 [Pilatotrama ljubarskyi]